MPYLDGMEVGLIEAAKAAIDTLNQCHTLDEAKVRMQQLQADFNKTIADARTVEQDLKNGRD